MLATSLLMFALPTALAANPEDWVGTRWQLNVEEVLPREVDLLAKDNLEFILKALQLRAIVACGEAELEGKKLVVRCTFEQVAIQATPHGENPTPRELQNSRLVIEDVAQHMREHGILEVVFTRKGKIGRVDVIGIEGDNLREKNHRERIRQLATDLAMGWTFETPKDWNGSWMEYNSPLMRTPSLPAAGGSTSIQHSGVTQDGRTVVQSVGSGVTTVHYTPWEFTSQRKVASRPTGNAPVEGGGSSLAGQPSVGGTRYQSGRAPGGATPSGATPEVLTYDVTLRSVAVVEPDTGMVVERVWTVAGAGTPSSVGSFQGVSLWYHGHLRRLSGTEQPDLGPTRIVHPPGEPIADLPAWVPMEP